MTVSQADVLTHLSFERVDDTDATYFVLRVKDGCARELAAALADRIVQGLTSPTVRYYEAWRARLDAGVDLSQEDRDGLEASVMADFRDEPRASKTSPRLLGAVAEHLWAAVAESLDGRWGSPLFVVHDHTSVIDHGPDGLSIYEGARGELRFRLWESKQHTGNKSLTVVFSNAANQLEQSGGRYLAQLSKVLQLDRDPRVQRFAPEMQPLWHSKDNRSAVGVSVGRSSSDLTPKRPLQGLAKKFGHLEPGGREAVLLEPSDFVEFALLVRKQIVRGVT